MQQEKNKMITDSEWWSSLGWYEFINTEHVALDLFPKYSTGVEVESVESKKQEITEMQC